MKRRMGIGHIVQRSKSKSSYSIKVSLGKDNTGKYKYLWQTVKGSKKDAQKRLTELLNQIDNGTLAHPKGTLGEFVEQWLTDYAKPNLSPTTYEGYKSIYSSGITPALGNILLKDLRPSHIQQYMGAKLSTGVSNTTVRHHLTFLHSVLDKAVKWQILTRNPVNAINMPRTVKHEMKILDVKQAERIFREVENTVYFPIYKLALYTGVRQSELLALQWNDVDLLMAELSINKASHRLKKGEYVIRGTKTKKSNRSIALSPDTCLMLRQHLENEINQCSKLGIKFTNDRLLFCEYDGKPIKPNTVRQYWARLLKRLKYPHIRYHDMRHTMASWMLMQGVSPKIVQERLGHANIGTTLDIYSHVTPGMQRQAVEGFDKLLKARHENEGFENN